MSQGGDVKLEKRLTLQVAAQVIKRISANLYRSPAGAIKELVSNSFDALATEVRVKFFLNYDVKGTLFFKKIVVADNGDGMDLDKLIHVLTHIGGSDKETLAEAGDIKLRYGRSLIGRLGIGMLSVAASCSQFVVRTKSKESNREYVADISLEFFNREIAYESLDKAEIGNVTVTSRSVKGKEYDSYTEVEIAKFTPPFMQAINENLGESFLYGKEYIGSENNDEDYFISFVDNVVGIRRLPDVQNFDKLILQLGLMTPVVYLTDGPVRESYVVEGREHRIPGTDSNEYHKLKKDLADYNFNVVIEVYKENSPDSKDILRSRFKLYKPLLFPTNADIEEFGEALDPFLSFYGPIEASFRDEDGVQTETLVRAYAYHQQKRIIPHEFRGLLYRVAGVAIGNIFEDLTRMYTESPVLLHQMAIEVYMDKGFQKIVNLDRESLFEGAMAYTHLQNMLSNWLRGDVPARPEIRESLTPENKGTIEIQKEFYETEKKVFPAPEKSLIAILRKRAADKRARRKSQQNPQSDVEDTIISLYKATGIQYKLSDFPENSEAKLDDSKELIVRLPRYSGPRRDLWCTLTLAILAFPPEDKERRKNLLKLIYGAYLRYEGM